LKLKFLSCRSGLVTACCPMAAAQVLPEWLRLYCAHAPAEDVAKSWKDGLDEAGRKEAEADKDTARARFRRLILDSGCPEVKADSSDGWKYTGSIMRATDAVLGIPPPKSRIAFAAQGGASGAGAPAISREVVHGDGTPGTLGVWWSDYGGATNVEQLRERGVTRRLNTAAEAVGKIPDDGSIPVVDVPMEDIFEEHRAGEAIATWVRQFGEVMEILRAWREEGRIVNINCQMGKNRSGCSCLIWMCTECGWKVEDAVDYLRKVTALGLANPHLVRAAIEYMQVEVSVPLNPAGDGGSWVCISPPGSPRENGLKAFEEAQRKIMGQQMASGGGPSSDVLAEKLAACRKAQDEESDDDPGEDVAPIFGDLSDVD